MVLSFMMCSVVMPCIPGVVRVTRSASSAPGRSRRARAGGSAGAGCARARAGRRSPPCRRPGTSPPRRRGCARRSTNLRHTIYIKPNIEDIDKKKNHQREAQKHLGNSLISPATIVSVNRVVFT